LNFYGDCVDILLNDFMVLVIDYDMNNINFDDCFSLIAFSSNVEIDASTRHAKLGHIGLQRMKQLAIKDLLESFANINLSVCKHYLVDKTTRKSFGK
jgi:hypothetical protein